MKKILFLTLSLGLVGAGCASTSTAPPSAAPQPAATPTPTQAVEPNIPLAAPLGSNGFTVSDQPAGAEITVQDVVLAKSGFVAVFADENGKPSALEGTSSMLNAGETRNVPIRLKTAAKTNEHHWVTLYTDNGDGTFSATTDHVASDEKGSPLTRLINITP